MKIKNVTCFLSAIVLGTTMVFIGCREGRAIRFDMMMPEDSFSTSGDFKEDFLTKKYQKRK